jgi:pimeloyl-ACP methyl ester carboxylesterase
MTSAHDPENPAVFDVRSHDGTPLGVRRSGDGTPVVLVHGAATGKDSFARLEPILAQTRAVWSYDRRGRGASGDHDDYSFDLEAEDFLAILEAATDGGRDQADVVAHSVGANVILRITQPAAVRSLAIYEPALFATRLDVAERTRLRSLLDMEQWDDALELFLRLYGGSSQQEVQFLQSRSEIWSRLKDTTRVLRREIDATEGDQLSQLEIPRIPLLALYGAETTCLNFPSDAELHRIFPTVRTQPIEGQRHLALLFAPEIVASALKMFWDSLSPVGGG